MKRKFSKCPTCSGQLKKRNPRPYGSTGTSPYCPSCDQDFVYKVSKSSERSKAKKRIRKELTEN